MILIKCCATCENYDDGTCTVDCHSTTADDWCPRWEDREVREMISELPSAQPETHDKRTETHECDLISRKMAIDAVVSAMIDGADAELVEGVMELLPSAQPERKKGKWIGYNTEQDGWKRTDGSPVFMSCSECNGLVLNNGSAHWNYCPNCGARMDGESDEML